MAESRTTEPVLTEKFQRAFALASEIHATQLRKKTSIPYMAHLMSVAALVLEYGGSEHAAIAGLLHDAVEDSENGSKVEARIRGEFGDRVADIVLGCSDTVAVLGQPKPSWRERKAAYLQHLHAESDPDVLLVSACDKLHNTRSILGDLRVIGPVVWDRFTEHDPSAQLWNYESLSDLYERRMPGALSDELKHTISQIRALVAL
jgi:GTP pyrophosphokinase